jgi:hypothetical protein
MQEKPINQSAVDLLAEAYRSRGTSPQAAIVVQHRHALFSLDICRKALAQVQVEAEANMIVLGEKRAHAFEHLLQLLVPAITEEHLQELREARTAHGDDAEVPESLLQLLVVYGVIPDPSDDA